MSSDIRPAVKSDMCCDIWSDFGPVLCFAMSPCMPACFAINEGVYLASCISSGICSDWQLF